jgi:hypothetical protein
MDYKKQESYFHIVGEQRVQKKIDNHVLREENRDRDVSNSSKAYRSNDAIMSLTLKIRQNRANMK